jgi:hypothetical protein
MAQASLYISILALGQYGYKNLNRDDFSGLLINNLNNTILQIPPNRFWY